MSVLNDYFICKENPVCFKCYKMYIQSMRKIWLWMIWLPLVEVAAGPAFNQVVLQHEASAALLLKKTIHLQTKGEVSVPFEDVCRILIRPDFLEAIQRAYAETLPDGVGPEFAVIQTALGKYKYTNSHQQETSVEEVFRRVVPFENVELILYSEGVRFFGAFQTLSRIAVIPTGLNRVSYSITVVAHPDSTAVRWLARVSPVKTFFKYKTRHLTDLVVEVCGKFSERDRQESGFVEPPAMIQ